MCFCLFRSEDEKSSTLVELQKVKKAISECQDQQASHVIRMGDLEDELKQVKSNHQAMCNYIQVVCVYVHARVF